METQMAQTFFTLVVNNFGEKHQCKKHTNYIISVPKEHYDIAEYREGKKNTGLTFDWDYKGQKFHLLIPGHV